MLNIYLNPTLFARLNKCIILFNQSKLVMTKVNLEGLTVAQIKAQYPNGVYKSSMKKADVIAAALATVKSPASKASKSNNNEPPYGSY
jgi:hypothetical protein